MPAQTSASSGPATRPRNASTMWRWDTGAVLVVLVKPALPSFKPVLHRGFGSMPAVGRILCGECPRIIEFWGIRVASNIEIEYASLHDGGGLYGLII